MSDDGSDKKDKKRSFSHILGIKRKEVTEEEILSMVDAGEEYGSVAQHERSRIENIFDFTDRSVSEIMTHRTDITALEDTALFDDAVALAISSGRSRIPVYHEDIDSVIGVLYVKDLLRYIGAHDFSLPDVVREVPFVPKSKSCEELFSLMTDEHVQIAIVIDEYGGTEGIVTLEDLVECVFGSIQDEYDDERAPVRPVTGNAFYVDGNTPVSDVEELLEVSLGGSDDTIAAFMLERLGSIPEKDERPRVTVDGVTFTVAQMDDRRIAKVLVVQHQK